MNLSFSLLKEEKLFLLLAFGGLDSFAHILFHGWFQFCYDLVRRDGAVDSVEVNQNVSHSLPGRYRVGRDVQCHFAVVMRTLIVLHLNLCSSAIDQKRDI